MRSLFRSKYIVTQVFNNNPSYYSQFKLKGHEGVDLVPSGTVRDVLALEDGVVVLDDDVVGSISSDPYGKIVTLWHTKINKATMYCHLSENVVTLGQIVKRGEKIGVMGDTGNTQGAHVHLNLFETDSNGIRQNRDNGYLGGIDPVPFLEESVEEAQDPALKECLAQHVDLVSKLGAIDGFRKALSKKLFSGDESKEWQSIFDQVTSLSDEVDGSRKLSRIANDLWDALSKETGLETVKYEQESLDKMLTGLQGLRNTPPEGKIIISSADYEVLKEKADKPFKNYTGIQLIIKGLEMLVRR